MNGVRRGRGACKLQKSKWANREVWVPFVVVFAVVFGGVDAAPTDAAGAAAVTKKFLTFQMMMEMQKRSVYTWEYKF